MMSHSIIIARKPKASIFVLSVLLLAGCKKDPEILQREDSRLAFYNASHVLIQEMQGNYGRIPILINTTAVDTITNDAATFEYASSMRQLAFPSINTGTLPWADYMRIQPGTQTIRFTGTDSVTILAEAEVETRVEAWSRLFLSDSLGTYHTFYLQDEGRAAASEARLRVTHLGPDAGELKLVINNDTLSLPQPLHYRSATDMIKWNIPSAQTDTLLRLQVVSTGTDAEVMGRVNLTLQPGETAHVVVYGYYNNASYEDPAKGETVTILPNFRVHAFKYN